jgi:hypothetical protein
MTPEQVSGLFDASESFVEGTIAAALVAIWLLVVALQLARPYMLTNLRKFTLRLGADLWWIAYVALRDILLVQVFLASFIFLYPDVVKSQDLPVTGGVAAVFAFGALVLKLTSKGEGDMQSFRWQTILLGLGALLYIGPYLLGVQLTEIDNPFAKQLAAILVTSQNPGWGLWLSYLSGFAIGVLGLIAVIYNLEQTTTRRSQVRAATTEE